MNKQIKHLAEQAKQYAEYVTPQGLEWLPVYSEHFARLIVKECAGLLVKEAESNHDENTPTYDILIQESNWMKKHFGVEE